MKCVMERETIAMREDFILGHYLGDMVKSRSYLGLQLQQLEDQNHIDLIPYDVHGSSLLHNDNFCKLLGQNLWCILHYH